MISAPAKPAGTTAELIHVDRHIATHTLAGASTVLKRDRREIIELCQAGRLVWVWNIAVDPDGQPEWRLLEREVDAFSSGRNPCKAWPLDQVIRQLFGGTKAFVDGTAFWRGFQCGDEHVTNLIAVGELAVVPGTGFGRGRGRTAVLTVNSVRNFLTSRRMTAVAADQLNHG